MSRILALAAVAALLAVSACKSVNQEAPQPSAVQPAPEANAAPGAAGMNVPGAAAETPSTAVKPVSAMPEATASEPGSKAKPAKAAPAASAGKPGVPTREQALALAAKGNCLICHKIDSKLVGPAWKEVAAKYKGDANAASTIAAHIKSGGSFGWKFGVMPPRGGSTISDADVASLAKFIAALK